MIGALYSRVRVHAEAARDPLLAGRHRQGAGELIGNLLLAPIAIVVNFVASLPGAVAALVRGRLTSRVPATILIALGGLVPSITSGLNRFGITWAFFLGEFVGVLLIFIGFLVSIEVFSDIRLPFTRVVLVRRKQPDSPDGAPA